MIIRIILTVIAAGTMMFTAFGVTGIVNGEIPTLSFVFIVMTFICAWNTMPDWWQWWQDRKVPPIDPHTNRPYGDHGTGSQAIQFALRHIDDPADQLEFLDLWYHCALDNYPHYYGWLRDPAQYDPTDYV